MTSKVGLVSLPFAGGYYRSKSRAFNDKRLINWYVNYPEEAGINDYQLLPCQGITGIPDLYFGEGNSFRGAHVMGGKIYIVAGDRVYQISKTGDIYNSTEITNFPDFITGFGRVIMASFKNQLVIVVPGVAGYLYTDGGSLVEITDPDFLAPQTVVAVDSYFVFSQTDTNVLFHSALNDGSSYSALDAYVVTQLPVVTGLIVYRNQLYVMGDKLTIPFSNQAQLQFSFRPIPSAAIENGVESNFLSINVRNAYVFAGRSVNSNISIWVYSSGSPVKISTPPIEYLLNQCSDSEISLAFLMQYTEAGTDCVSITFSVGSSSYCFVYDSTASARSGKPEWHERATTYTSVYDGIPAWDVIAVVNCFGRNMVITNGSNLGYLDDKIGTEFSVVPRRVLNTQPFSVMGVNTKVSQLEIYTDVGVDDNSLLTVSWSDDGGFNYGNKISLSTGAIGDYNHRVILNQLGAFSRQRMLQLEYTGEYPRAINKITANIQ